MFKDAVITSGRANPKLAREIAEHCGVPFMEIDFKNFGDGDWKPRFPETISGLSLFIVQPTNPVAGKHMGEHLYELLVINDAAQRASVKEVVAVIPYFGGARQDRKDEPRVPITAKLNAKLIENAGIKRVITMDLHADQIQGFFDIPVDNLHASYFFIPQIKKLELPNLSISSADVGGARRAEAYAKHLKVPLIICYKSKVNGVVEKIVPLGEVRGRNIVLLDDIVDSAGTITKAANVLMEEGASAITGFATHAVLSGEACERIEASAFKKFYFLDTIKVTRESPKIEVIPSAPIFGEAIKERMTPGGSVSKKLFVF